MLLAPGASFGAFSLPFVLRGLPLIAFKRRRFAESCLRWAAMPAVDDAPYESWMEALIDVMDTGIRAFRGPTLPYLQKLPPAVMRAIAAPTLLVPDAT